MVFNFCYKRNIIGYGVGVLTSIGNIDKNKGIITSKIRDITDEINKIEKTIEVFLANKNNMEREIKDLESRIK